MTHEAPADLAAWIKDNERIIRWMVGKRHRNLISFSDAYAIVLVAVWKAVETYDPSKSAFATHATWKMRSAITSANCRAIAQRRRRREWSYSSLDRNDTAVVFATKEGPSQAHEAIDVRRFVEKLPPADKTVITLLYGLGGEGPMTLPEVGKALGYSKQRAHQIEARALGRLRRYMGIEGAA